MASTDAGNRGELKIDPPKFGGKDVASISFTSIEVGTVGR